MVDATGIVVESTSPCSTKPGIYTGGHSEFLVSEALMVVVAGFSSGMGTAAAVSVEGDIVGVVGPSGGGGADRAGPPTPRDFALADAAKAETTVAGVLFIGEGIKTEGRDEVTDAEAGLFAGEGFCVVVVVVGAEAEAEAAAAATCLMGTVDLFREPGRGIGAFEATTSAAFSLARASLARFMRSSSKASATSSLSSAATRSLSLSSPRSLSRCCHLSNPSPDPVPKVDRMSRSYMARL